MTRKPIKLPKETIEAMLNGATKFIIPINESDQCGIVIDEIREDMISFSTYEKGTEKCWDNTYIENLIKDYALLQIDDEFYVQENFTVFRKRVITEEEYDNNGLETLIPMPTSLFNPASQMTYEQSRLKDLVVVNVEIKRVKEDINNFTCIELGLPDMKSAFIDWYNKQYNNYEENPYVFLVTAEKKK